MTVPYSWTVYVRLHSQDGSVPPHQPISQILVWESAREDGRELCGAGMQANGICELHFGREKFYPPRERPTLVIEVHGAMGELLHTQTFNNVSNLSTLDIYIQSAVCDDWTVHGTVRFESGGPLTSGRVKAFDTYHEPDRLLDDQPVSGDGTYALSYTDATFEKSPAHQAPDLLVNAYNPENEVIATATRSFPSRDETIELVVADSPEIWNISGTVIRYCGSPFTDGKLHAIDVHNGLMTLIDTPPLGSNGEFSFSFTKESFQVGGATHAAPDLQIKVYDSAGTKLLGESEVYESVAYTAHIPIRLKEEENGNGTGDDPCGGGYGVHGKVLNQLGLRVVGINIRALHLYFDESSATSDGHHFFEKTLGSTVSDNAGAFFIGYKAEDIIGGDCGCCTPADRANLIVEAYEEVVENDPDTGEEETVEKVLYRSSLLYQAEKCQEIDITVDKVSNVNDSEYIALTTALEKCLGPAGPDSEVWWNGLRAVHKNEAYLNFVANTLGRPTSLVWTYVRSWMLFGDIVKKMDDELESIDDITPEVVYGLVRGGLPDWLSALLGVDATGVFNTLIRSIGAGFVSSSMERNLSNILEDWRYLVKSLIKYTGSEDDKTGWQHDLLEKALSDDTSIEDFLDVNFDHEGNFSELCDELYYSGTLTEMEVENLRFAFELYELTGRYFHLVDLVMDDKMAGNAHPGSLSDWHNVGDLAALGIFDVFDGGDLIVKGWVSYLEAIVADRKSLPTGLPGKTDADKIVIFATRLYDALGKSAPQKRFVSRMAVEAARPGIPESPDCILTSLSVISAFFQNNPAYSLEYDNIDKYTPGSGPPISDDLKTDIKTCQRIYRLTSEFSAVWALFNAGFDSAFKVSNMGENRFVAEHEQELGGPEMALAVYRTAAHYTAELMAHVAQFHQTLNTTGGGKALPNEFSIKAFSADGSEGNSAGLSKYPNWITLFGDLNKCSCEHCETVFSPAAYLVDLLEYVNADQDQTLMNRRPDLEDLELTCPNTNRVLPYIDLVNEILELAIVPLFLIRSNNEFEDPTQEANRTAIMDKLKAFGYTLTEQADIGIVNEDNPYGIIRDDACRYTVWKNTTDHYVVRPSPQTGTSNNDLEVYPEHIHRILYEDIHSVDGGTFPGKLNRAVFPFLLPFDLGREEVDILLEHKKTPLFQIKESFYPGGITPPYHHQTDAALTYLNLSPARDRAFRGEGGPAWRFWGLEETGNTLPRPDKPTDDPVSGNWLEILAMMPFFLHRSGLDYQALLDLLDTEYIQSGLSIHIDANASAVQECNINEYRLVNLDENGLFRINFFIRLWRHLGWTMQELDRFLMGVEFEDGADPIFSGAAIPQDLRMLYFVKNLSDTFDLPVREVCSWWAGQIDHRSTERTDLSLFEEVFLIGSPDDEEYKALKLFCADLEDYHIDLTEPDLEDDPNSIQFEPTLRAALRVDADEYRLLLDNEIADLTEVDLSDLTALYRTVSFCNAVGLEVSDYYALKALFGESNWPDPFARPIRTSGDDTWQTESEIFDTVKIIDTAKSSGMGLPELQYLLCHIETLGASWIPTREDILGLIASLNEMARTVEESFPEFPDEEEDALVVMDHMMRFIPKTQRTQLTILMTEDPGKLPEPPFTAFYYEYLHSYMRFIHPEAVRQFVISDPPEQKVKKVWDKLRPYLVEKEKDKIIIDILSDRLSLKKDTVFALLSVYLEDGMERWQRIMNGGWRTIKSSAGTTAIQTWITPPKDEAYRFFFENLSAEDPDVTLLIDGVDVTDGSEWGNVSTPMGYHAQWTRSHKANAPFLIELTYPTPANVEDEPTIHWRTAVEDWHPFPDSAANPFETPIFTLISKSAALINSLGLDNAALKYLDDTGKLIFNEFPVEVKTTLDPSLWSKFSELVTMKQVAAQVRPKTKTIFELWSELFPLEDDNDAKKRIADETAWDENTIGIVKALVPGATTWDDTCLWAKLVDIMALVKRLGLSATQIKALLVDTPPNLKGAAMLRNIFKSQYSPASWKEALKPPRDVLRRKQRDALTGYCCSHPINFTGKTMHFFDENDLYAYLLIDVEMEPDTLASRIKLAISSIQLFVQRLFMGLEEDDVFPDIGMETARERWKWMKNYRVWEANRKVFLYPENWIEPELRDDKSEFFEELEKSLREDDLSGERVTYLLNDYLEKVNDVSDLEIVGCYKEDTAGEGEGVNYILYVVGRTKSAPYTYYQRTYIKPQAYNGEWTPWKRIALDVSAPVAVPVVYNRRLYLFWLILQNKKVDHAPRTEPIERDEDVDVTPSDIWTEIKLVWSEYIVENAKWSKPKIAKRPVYYDRAHVPLEKRQGEPDHERYNIRAETNKTDCIDIWIFTGINTEKELTWENIGFGRRGRELKALGYFRVWENGDSYAKSITEKPMMADSYLRMLTRDELKYYRDSDFEYNAPIGIVFQGNFAYEDADACYDEQSISYLAEFDKLQFQLCRPTFENAPERYKILAANFGFLPPYTADPGFFITPTKTLFYQNKGLSNTGGTHPQNYQFFKFETFNNPQIRTIQRILLAGGPKAIMDRLVEALPVAENIYTGTAYCGGGDIYLGYWIADDRQAKGTARKLFETEFMPDAGVERPYPWPTVDFEYGTSFGLYNWELFFHVPLLIADRLSQEMKFEEAMEWFHFIFDPRQGLNNYEQTKRWADDLPAGSKYWNFLPFFANKEATLSLQSLLGLREEFTPDERMKLATLINAWKDDPFNPHLIARQRIVAYQKAVVMKYLDNLIAWADQLFRQDTFESINEATQFYIMADEILGERPPIVKSSLVEKRGTYNELKEIGMVEFANAIVELENLLVGNEYHIKQSSLSWLATGVDATNATLIDSFYFPIPMNEKLLTYWDTVQDRLFKIRNSMNIDGVKRSLALFQPPIDPGMLVKAAAAGVDLSAVLAQMNAPMPHYRFNTWLQKAMDLTNELKSFGGAILSALEKKDSEALSLLRSDHEIRMLNLMTEVKKKQIEEAEIAIEALKKSKALAKERYDEYRTRSRISKGEMSQMRITDSVARLETSQANSRTIAGVISLIPQIDFGTVTPFPKITAAFGGQQLAAIINAGADATGAEASQLRAFASKTGTLAGYDRRWEDWKLQERLAFKEMEQIDTQIAGAEVRLKIAEKELENHETQIEHALEIKEFMQDKFTNKELYQWMISQLSVTYRELYKMAFDVAKMAEKTYQFELGIEKTSFIKFGYMDSLRKGLLAGETLIADLKRMDISYLEKNKREFEITKPISLREINEEALHQLRKTGACDFELPEVLFDLDFAGQYFRRIKTVRITIPCVTGPHVSVSAKLSLLGSCIRKNIDTGGGYAYTGLEDGRFIHDPIGIQSIATGSAQNDAGLFELNFRDERYLPFEGAGVISRWRLELPHKEDEDDGSLRQFDYSTISDVIVNMSYTARDGGGLLKQKAQGEIVDALNLIREIVESDSANSGLIRIFSLKKEFPDVLHALLNDPDATGTPVAHSTVNIKPTHFSYLLRSGFDFDQIVDGVTFVVQSKAGHTATAVDIGFEGDDKIILLAEGEGYSASELATEIPDDLTGWSARWPMESNATRNDIKDILIVVTYTIKAQTAG